MTDNGMYTNEPRPRLCHLRRWPDFQGYGFNLHTEKDRQGQYIGKVDRNSPAESAGLKQNDRIVEVNYVSIRNELHKQVVTRIKEGVTRNGTKYPNEVILLVVDEDTDEYYKSQSRVIRSTDPNVERLEAENRDGSEVESNSSHSSNNSIGHGYSEINKTALSQTKSNESNQDYKYTKEPISPIVKNKRFDSPSISRTSDETYEPPPNDDEVFHQTSTSVSEKNEQHQEYSQINNAYTNIHSSSFPTYPQNNSNTKPVSQTNSSQSLASNKTGETLNCEMSVAEFRKKLAQNPRKRDVRIHQNMSIKEKHDVINRL